MNKLGFSKWLMIAAIFVIGCFQAYWLKQLYNEEFNNLKTQTNVLLKQSVQELQNKKLKSDSAFIALINKPSVQKTKIDSVNKTRFQNLNNGIKKQKKFFEASSKNLTTPLPKIDSFFGFSQTKELPNSNNAAAPKRVITISNTSDGSIINIDSFLNKMDPRRIKSIHVVKDSSITIRSSSFKPNEISFKKTPKNDSVVKTISLVKSSGSFNRDTSFSKGNNVIRISSSFKMDSLKTVNFNGFFIKLLTDTIPAEKIDSAFKNQLQKDKVNIPFALIVRSKEQAKDSNISENKLTTNFVSSGIIEPVMYKAEFKNPFKYIAKKLALPFALSILLLAFVTTAFVVLYKNMKAQHKLATMKNDFISNITHELKTPISTVSVAVEAMRNFNALNNPQKTKEYLDISASEISRLSLLVDNVLKLTMFENDKIELDKQSFDIVQLINEILNALSIQFEQHQAIIEFQPSQQHILVYADKLHLSSVIFNLLDNAIKYSKNQPTIFVTAQQLDGRIEIKVKDQGIGIEKQYHDKIFNKFFRVSQGTDRHNVKGYGLGLSYVYYIIKKHNGHINIESEKNKGTTFIINLPA